MRFLLVFQDIILNLQNTINELSDAAFMAIIAALSILLMALFRFIIKYAYNANVIRKNVVTPLVFAVIVIGILVGLLTLRS